MQRPRSIRLFEQLYILSFVLGLATLALTWSQRTAMLARIPGIERLGWLLPATTAAGIAIAVTLWYLVARRGSAAAKWIVVAFAAFAVFQIGALVIGLAAGRSLQPLVIIVGGLQNLAYVAAATLLFRSDTRAWFGEAPRGTGQGA